MSCSELQIGYSIIASVVPCLKNFIAPYEKPIATQSSYPSYGNGSKVTYELSSVAGRSEVEVEPRSPKGKPLVPLSRSLSKKWDERHRDRGSEEEGVVHEACDRRSLAYFAASAGPACTGQLRPEHYDYQARVQSVGAAGDGDGDGDDKGSLDSGNSRRMIIKKGVEWSVNYDSGTAIRDDKN